MMKIQESTSISQNKITYWTNKLLIAYVKSFGNGRHRSKSFYHFFSPPSVLLSNNNQKLVPIANAPCNIYNPSN